jgi:hypothetical protein
MKQVAWMAGGSVAVWLCVAAVAAKSSGSAAFFGMLGPLLTACWSWVMAERTYTRDPRALTGRMVMAFAFKLVFFGGYVGVMLRVVRLSPVPFVVSFSGYFIALHVAEAVFLSRLFASGSRQNE